MYVLMNRRRDADFPVRDDGKINRCFWSPPPMIAVGNDCWKQGVTTATSPYFSTPCWKSTIVEFLIAFTEKTGYLLYHCMYYFILLAIEWNCDQ